MDMIADGLVSAARLGARIHIRRCSDTIRFRVDVGGANVNVATNHLLDAISRIDTSRITISNGARIKLAKHAKRWGGPNRAELVKRIRSLPSTIDRFAFGERIHMKAFADYQAFVTTGRVSSSKPNLQNVPIPRASQRT